MCAFDTSLNIYRKTVKRIKPLHIAVHAVVTHVTIPFLERVNRFQTMPDDPFWFRLELLTNRHEAETVRQIKRLVKPGMTVLDIGAHVGYYARLFSRSIGETGRVIAFEPHPRTFEVLHGNVGHLSNVTLVQVALAEEEGTAELYDYLMMSASGSLHYDESMRDLQKSQLSSTDIAPRITHDFPVREYTVRTAPVDSCLEQSNIDRVDVVKMDIEGAEIGALRGMKRTIANSPRLALVMEYNPQALRAFGHDPMTALLEVLAMGFDRVQIIETSGALTDLTHDETALRQLTARLMGNMGVVNLLFTRES